MSVLFPRYPSSVNLQFARVAASLFSFDQFDDWLPDPIYYNDQSDDEVATIRRVESRWSASVPASFEPEVLELPRKSGSTVPAIALPLDLRLCAHALVTVMASRISTSLRRDKVYGFRFLRSGSRVFDQAGGELASALELVVAAANATSAGSFDLLDIAAFNASANADLFSQTLQRCGARPDEAHAISALARLGGIGLASVDDAFACAYNFYLQPIDEELFQAKRNFFRYRDEYFVFNAATGVAVRAGAQRLGLVARSKGSSANVRDIDRTQMGTEELFRLPNGSILASVYCPSTLIDGRCSDQYEIAFERDEPSLKWLFQLSPSELVDAVDVLPALRSVHKRRQQIAVLAPPFGSASIALNGYRAELAKGRDWLALSLSTAIKRNSSWQAGWCAMLLADIGALSEAESQAIKYVATSASFKESAKAQARVALARSSALDQSEFWGKPGTATEFQRRSTLTAARHLARRSPAVWNSARGSLGPQEPGLVRHLTAFIPEGK